MMATDATQRPGAAAPLVDVVMTAHDAASHLEECLRGLAAQTLGAYRLIAVDDGSTDDTAALLAAAAAADGRIIVISQPNRGIVAAANAGLARCEAPFVARHDADDISDPDRLRAQLAFLEAHPDCIAVAGAARHVDEAGRDLGTRTRLRDPSEADDATAPAREPYLLHPFLMVRRDALLAVGGYRPLQSAEDSDLFWRLREFGRMHNMAEVLGSYRLHPNSISGRSVRHGRRMAFCSQLAAASARRRREGRPDLRPDEALVRAVERADTLSGLAALASPILDDGERRWLAAAAGLKLLELCFYRDYEPDPADCRFIRGAWIRERRQLSVRNRAEAREVLLGSAVRLVLKRRWREGLLLVEARRLPLLPLRVLFRLGLPDGLRDRIKRATGRRRPVAPAAGTAASASGAATR